MDPSDASHQSSSSSTTSEGTASPHLRQDQQRDDPEEGAADKENRERHRDGTEGREKRPKKVDRLPGGDNGRKLPDQTRETSKQRDNTHRPYSSSHRRYESREYSVTGPHSSAHHRGHYPSQLDRHEEEDSPASSASGSLEGLQPGHHTITSGQFGSRHQYSDKSTSSSLATWGVGSFGDRRYEHGTIPKKRQVISDFDPNALRQEARACLEQLHGDRRGRLDPPPTTTGYESQRKAQRTLSSHQDVSHKKSCHCKSSKTSVPYKCPYCTPIQNSSFGHAKDKPKKSSDTRDTNKGTSNVARNAILTSMDTDKKKVLYKPSASTIVIEKHITK